MHEYGWSQQSSVDQCELMVPVLVTLVFKSHSDYGPSNYFVMNIVYGQNICENTSGDVDNLIYWDVMEW